MSELDKLIRLIRKILEVAALMALGAVLWWVFLEVFT